MPGRVTSLAPVTPVASVVIPAHDEASVLPRCLDALLAGPLDLEVVVVANACSDATAELARARGVRVVETPVPGKAHALDLGDAACTAFPRAYLDADVVLPQAALAAALEALRRPGVLATAPRLAWDPTGVPRRVRAFYRVWTALPYVTDGLLGSGVYVLSQEGRQRFDRFPDAIGDDVFVRSLFAPRERPSSDGVFTISPPRTLRALVAIKTRAWTGNAQHDLAGGAERTPAAQDGGGSGGTLRALLRRPDVWSGLPVYAGVYGVARLRGRRRAAQGRTKGWERDTTSR